VVNIELLKKLTFIADITRELEPFLFDDIEIRINTLLENRDEIIYAFQVLKVPFMIFTSEAESVPEEINVCFGREVDKNVIYLITYILKEVYSDALDVYISYAVEPAGIEKRILVGSYIEREMKFTNISAPISASEIIRLAVYNMDWDEFESFFPNTNYSENGKCIYNYSNSEPAYYNHDYDNYDDSEGYGSSYEKYGGYNGWSDDAIDDAFEGDPMNTWNVD